MPQQPSLSASSLTNERDSVAREVFGASSFSAIGSNNQTDVTTEGNAAFYEVTQWARWYTEVSPDVTDLPSEWNEAFRQVWIAKCKRRFRSPQEFHIHWSMYVQPLLTRIAEHYTANWNSTSALSDGSASPGSIRRSVIAMCVRQRTPVFPVILELDTMIREEFVKLWEERHWEFTKRPLKVTITTSGDVIAADAFIFDGMASKEFVIRTSGGALRKVKWIDATRHAEMAARLDGQTGVPRYFYDVDQGDDKTIQFLPLPDQNYEAFCVIWIGAPAFAGAESTTGIENLPEVFRGNLRDYVFAKAVSRWGREDVDATRAFNYAAGERSRLAAQWASKGAPRSTARGHHNFKFVNNLMSSNTGHIIGNMG